jgi:hypothetical protein
MSTIDELRSILEKARRMDRAPHGGVPRWKTLEPMVKREITITGETGDEVRRKIVKEYIDENQVHVGSSSAYGILLGDAYVHHIEKKLPVMEAEAVEAAAAEGSAKHLRGMPPLPRGGQPPSKPTLGGGRKRKSKKRKSKKKKTRRRRR